MQRLLIIAGAVLLAIGLLWPWIQRLGLGRLPGDIVIERDDFQLYLPITTMILVSLVLTVLIWLFRK